MRTRTPNENDTRTTLLGRVKDLNDHASWRNFYSIYAKLVRSQALNAGLNETEADDVVQETLTEVSTRMPTFVYDRTKGSFKAWLLQLARWRIISQMRKRKPLVISIDVITETGENSSDLHSLAPELTNEFDRGWEQSWEQAIFELALEALKRKWSLKHYQAIDLHVVKHLEASIVCRTLGINRAHLYMLKVRAVRLLKNEVVRLSKHGPDGI